MRLALHAIFLIFSAIVGQNDHDEKSRHVLYFDLSMHHLDATLSISGARECLLLAI